MQNLTAFLYLVSGVLFILALRGLSHPESSRQGNLFGMIGMGIAIVTTLPLGIALDRRGRADHPWPRDRRRRWRLHRARIP